MSEPDATNMPADTTSARAVIFCRRLSAGLGAVVALVGLTVLTGWRIEQRVLTKVADQFASMKPLNALSFVCEALAILLLATTTMPGSWRRIFAATVASISLVVGGSALGQDLLGRDIGVDTLLFHDAVLREPIEHPGRMSPATALCHVLISASLLWHCPKQKIRGRRVDEPALAAVLIIASISIAGYLYGTAALYAVGPFRTVALQTVVCLVLVAPAVLLLQPDVGITRFITESTFSGWLLRRLLPGALLVPLALGYLARAMVNRLVYDWPFALAVFVAACAVLFTILVVWAAMSIRHGELRQLQHRRSILAAKESAERANRAKDELLGIVSHELRTPLTPAMLHLNLLERNPDLNADVRADLAVIRRQLELETRVIDDLLDVTRIGVGKLGLEMQCIDAAVPIADALEWARIELADGGPRLRVDLTHDPCPVRVDPLRLEQIIVNLLQNAIKFTPGSGTIVVRSRVVESTRFELDVIDTGRGIAPENLPRLFDAFAQEDSSMTRQYGGLGLGLTIARGLGQLMGGGLTLKSEGVGQGTQAVLWLPIARRQDTVRRESPAPGKTRSIPAALPVRILLVEDHDDTRTILQRLLQRHGHHVTATGTCKDALAAAQSQAFDLIISDLALPDGNGADLLAEINQRLRVPAIALSGFGMDEDIRRSHDAGFLEHLTKPVQIETLLEAIQRLVKQSRSVGATARQSQ